MKLTVAISPCPNDIFIFAGILLGKTVTRWSGDFRFEDVETLNGLARAGEYDLIKISYANAPQLSGYCLLNCGGALGRGCGPLLLTGGGPWNPDGEVLVPGAHTTANFLLDYWAGRPLRKRFLPFDTLYEELKTKRGAQGVVIHEMRFTYARDKLTLVQDLGSHWEHSTGHPIPLGAVAYRETPGTPSQAEMEADIRKSLDWACAHPDLALELCARYSQSLEASVIRSHVDLYVNDFSRDLGPRGRAAVEYFLSHLQNRPYA